MVVLTLFLLASTNHIVNSATTTNTVSFDGEGKVFAKPDIAAISFSIVTEATTSKAAQDSNSQKSNKVVAFLKSQGIDDKDIKTTGYNVYPQYSYPRPMPLGVEVQSAPSAPSGAGGTTAPQYYDPNPKISGYQVNQTFEVKVRDLEKVSAILDGLVTQGANQVNNLGFQVDDIEKVKDEARAMAIKNAKEKASKLQRQIGIRLGKIVNYSEGNNYPGPYYMEAKAMDGRGGAAVPPTPSVPAGENEITVNVSITYQIR